MPPVSVQNECNFLHLEQVRLLFLSPHKMRLYYEFWGVMGQIFISLLLCLLVQMFVLKYVSKSFSCLHLKSVQLFDSCEEGNGIKLVKMEIYYFV